MRRHAATCGHADMRTCGVLSSFSALLQQTQVPDNSESLKQHLHACLHDLTSRVQQICQRTDDSNVWVRTDEAAHGPTVSCAPPAQGDAHVTLDPHAPNDDISPPGEGSMNEDGVRVGENDVCVTPWDDELRVLRSRYAASGQEEAPGRAADTSIEHHALASTEQDDSVKQHLKHDASMQHALLSSVCDTEEAETCSVLAQQRSSCSPWLLPTPILLTEEGRTERQGAACWSEAEVIEEAGDVEEEEEEEEEEECLSRAKRLLAFLKSA